MTAAKNEKLMILAVAAHSTGFPTEFNGSFLVDCLLFHDQCGIYAPVRQTERYLRKEAHSSHWTNTGRYLLHSGALISKYAGAAGDSRTPGNRHRSALPGGGGDHPEHHSAESTPCDRNPCGFCHNLRGLRTDNRRHAHSVWRLAGYFLCELADSGSGHRINDPVCSKRSGTGGKPVQD